jgi:DME family drug/metabolite transporter
MCFQLDRVRRSTRAQMNAESRFQARAMALLAAVLFSTGGAAIKTEAFNSLQISSARSGIAVIALLLFVRGRWHISLPIVGTGVAYAAALTVFVAATRLTTAASAIFLQATAPLYLLVIGPWLLKEHLGRRDVGYAVAMTAGLLVCLAGQPVASSTAPDPATGNLLGLGSGLLWAATLAGLRFVSKEAVPGGGLSAVIVGNGIACLAVLPFVVPFPSAAVVDWANLLYLGVVQIGVAYVCLTKSLDHLPAFEVSLFLLLEPVLNPVWTWLVRGEQPGVLAVVGGACILAASAFRTLTRTADA